MVAIQRFAIRFIGFFRIFSLQGRRYIDQPLEKMFSQRILPERARGTAEN